MDIRVDFIDLKDSLSRASGVIQGFKPVHVGLLYGEYYLLVPAGQPSKWHTRAAVERHLGRFTVHSFKITPDNHSIELAMLLGDGHVASSPLWLFLTEFWHRAADSGLVSFRPQRTACVRVVSNILMSMGLDVDAHTSPTLFKQLSSSSKATRLK